MFKNNFKGGYLIMDKVKKWFFEEDEEENKEA